MTDRELARKISDGLISQLVDRWHADPKGEITLESLDQHTQGRVRTYAGLINNDPETALECLSEDAAVLAYYEDPQLHAPDAANIIDAVWVID